MLNRMDRDLPPALVRGVLEEVLASEFKTLRLQLELRDKTTYEGIRHIAERIGPELEIRERLAVLEDRLPKR
jgi:hypothetical protein